AGGLKSTSRVAAVGADCVMPPPPYWMPIGWSLRRSVPMLVISPALIFPAVWLAPVQAPACQAASPTVPDPGALITALIDVTPSWQDRQAIDTEPTGATLPSSVDVPRLCFELAICALAGRLVATPTNATARTASAQVKPLRTARPRSTHCPQPMLCLLEVKRTVPADPAPEYFKRTLCASAAQGLCMPQPAPAIDLHQRILP